jgi:hypothetical protein
MALSADVTSLTRSRDVDVNRTRSGTVGGHIARAFERRLLLRMLSTAERLFTPQRACHGRLATNQRFFVVVGESSDVIAHMR